MRKPIAIACAIALGASALYAGGPVVVVDEEVAVEQPSSSSGALIPLLLLTLIGLAVASGEDDGPANCI